MNWIAQVSGDEELTPWDEMLRLGIQILSGVRGGDRRCSAKRGPAAQSGLRGNQCFRSKTVTEQPIANCSWMRGNDEILAARGRNFVTGCSSSLSVSVAGRRTPNMSGPVLPSDNN